MGPQCTVQTHTPNFCYSFAHLTHVPASTQRECLQQENREKESDLNSSIGDCLCQGKFAKGTSRYQDRQKPALKTTSLHIALLC